jgi:beta-lactamase superfamily II metal-dependent hydrolase
MGLEVHCINSGQGNSVALRLPDDAVMIVDIDCHGDTPVDPVDYLKELVPEEYDADEGRQVRRLACAAFTHPHEDHISGLKPLADEGFVFDEIWESGHRLSDEDAKDNPAYEDYLSVIEEYEEQGKVKKPTSAGGKWREGFHGVDVHCLGPSRHLNAADADDTSREAIHNRCLILRIVTDEMSALLPGDSAVNQWRDRIVPNYDADLLEADVLVASHHGSRTFFKKNKDDDPYEDAIELIAPNYTLISVGEDNDYDHPHEDALKLYQEHTGGAVAQTKLEGSILVKAEDGEVTLEPSPVDAQVEEIRAATKSASLSLATVPKISLSAVLLNKHTKRPLRPLKNGASKVPRNEYVVFSADVRNRPAGTRLEWEVKNWVVDDHSHHNERYGKGESAGRYDLSMGRNDGEHEWTRHTSYTGRHECVVRLVDPLWGRVLTSERFVVHVGRPRSRYLRKLGRTR